jgi:hypothetical protein
MGICPIRSSGNLKEPKSPEARRVTYQRWASHIHSAPDGLTAGPNIHVADLKSAAVIERNPRQPSSELSVSVLEEEGQLVVDEGLGGETEVAEFLVAVAVLVDGLRDSLRWQRTDVDAQLEGVADDEHHA